MAEAAYFGETLKSAALAAADLSSAQLHFVKIGSSGVTLNSVVGAGGLKVLGNKPVQGEACQLFDIGEVKAVAGAALNVGDIVMSDGSGRAVTFVDNGSNVPVAECRIAVAGANMVTTIFVFPNAGGIDNPAFSAADGISAAGSTQADATQLTAKLSRVTTVTSGQGVALVAAVAGAEQVVVNADGTDTLKIYGAVGSSDTIDGTAGSAGVTLTAAHRVARFTSFADGKWVSDLGGAVAT